MSDLEEQAARLAAEVTEASSKNRQGTIAGKGRALAAAGAFGVAAVAVSAFFLVGDDEPVSVPETAQPEQFQTEDGSPFGTLPAPKRETIVTRDNSETEALRKQVEDLMRELKALREAPQAVAADPAMEARLESLQGQLSGLTEQMKQTDEMHRKAMEAKDREMARLQAALDAATLTGAPAPGTDPVADQRRAEAEALRQRRVSSAMIAFGGSGGADGAAADAENGGSNADSANGRKLSDNAAFAREGAAAAKVERARVIANPSNTIVQGTMVQATLETFINSDLPGQIRAVVAEDVHSYDGSRVLIPRGSKVIGQYSDNVEQGQRRAMIVWTRLILPDNQTVEFSSVGGDAIGQSGMGGRVNTHFLARFGSATLISLLTLAPSLMTDSSGSETAQDAADTMSENLSSATGAALAGALERPPTITIPQGSSVSIMVDRDLEIF